MDHASNAIQSEDGDVEFDLDVESILVAQQFVDEARDIERVMDDRITAAKLQLDKCEHRVDQVEMALNSGMFDEFPMEPVYRLRELRASVRVKHQMLSRLLEQAHRLADECDEKVTLHEAAERLGEPERQRQAQGKLKELLTKLKSIYEETKAVYEQLSQQSSDQLTIFTRLRRR
jgi:hypothetical protein